MTAEAQALYAHLATGHTTVCHAWEIRRKDGTHFGFTDHDCDLSFDGKVFKARSGLTARALQQTTGLSVDNSEAIGALSDLSISEQDILAGRFDGAELVGWQVNWANPQERVVSFRGTLGEIVRAGGSFQAELRGLTEKLNQPQGRAFQRSCPAILGDSKCRFDLAQAGYRVETKAESIADRRILSFTLLDGTTEGWFEKGRLVVLSGKARGDIGIIKRDRLLEGKRVVELWERLGHEITSDDQLRLEAGCDKRAATCRSKFNNFLNFRGFPDMPGEDWLTSYPVSTRANSGGSLVR